MTARRPRACVALDGADDRCVLRNVAEMASERGPSPAMQERRAHAAGDPQPPSRAHGERMATKAWTQCLCRWISDCPTSRWSSRQGRWDRPEAGRKARLPQRADHVIAPTGTIGLVMDCDTTGIEPDFALVKFKKLAGGGYFKIINRSCPARWRIWAIINADRRRSLPTRWARHHGNAPGINHTA